MSEQTTQPADYETKTTSTDNVDEPRGANESADEEEDQARRKFIYRGAFPSLHINNEPLPEAACSTLSKCLDNNDLWKTTDRDTDTLAPFGHRHRGGHGSGVQQMLMTRDNNNNNNEDDDGDFMIVKRRQSQGDHANLCYNRASEVGLNCDSFYSHSFNIVSSTRHNSDAADDADQGQHHNDNNNNNNNNNSDDSGDDLNNNDDNNSSSNNNNNNNSNNKDLDVNSKWSWKDLRREFKLTHSESLFHTYQARLQQSFFVVLLILNIIFNSGAVMVYLSSQFSDLYPLPALMRLASLFVFGSFLTLIWFNKIWMRSEFSRTVASLAVLLAMIFAEASGAICALVNDQSTPLARIRLTYYLIITNHVFLPFPSRIQSCAATIVIASLEIIVTYISRLDNNCKADFLTQYSVADIIFYASSAMIGFQITFLLEIATRRTFLNHRYCIQSTYKLEYEKEQQEQLLRSCFPQHLIEQIRTEIMVNIHNLERKFIPFKPFYNLYVQKYENVTILYADIVNSMTLTDKLRPAELVETLNELYGRFDESAEKNHCLRIKLLGDCYYCVSGMPIFDPDHAINSLMMGLEMIKIINSVRQHRQVDIDMRIGVNSGSVLSGLLGLRKWQFDIWSIDAMKANRMEHNGQPGFVHITQRTLDLIPKSDKRRDNLIITSTHSTSDSEITYLISERINLNNSSSDLSTSPMAKRRGQTEKLKAHIEKLRGRSSSDAMIFAQRRVALETSLKKYREIHAKVDKTMKSAIGEMPLGQAWKQFFFINCKPTKIDGHHGGKKRRKKISQSDPLFHLYLICVGLITLSILAIRCLIPGMPIYSHTVIGFAFIIITIIISLMYIYWKQLSIGRQFRILLWLIISASLTMLQLVDLIVPDEKMNSDGSVHVNHIESMNCAFAWYYTFTIIMAMTATSIFIRINVWLKFILHLSTIVLYISFNNKPATIWEVLSDFFESQETNWSFLDHKQKFSHLYYIILIAVVLHLIDRQVEYILNLNVQWSNQLKTDKDESELVGLVNKMLLRNILPPHVLRRYLYNTSVSYDQLYHESHSSCAVMFASIPNYESFYTENNLNEQGLKCLQLLNEIICDFDQLLSHPAFHLKIEKIKTIGSTYMAACLHSGYRASEGNIVAGHIIHLQREQQESNQLGTTAGNTLRAQFSQADNSQSFDEADNNDDNQINEEEHEIEVTNVVTMVCFATALMENLARINRDAFQDFCLRIGISAGPVIAGVVGASKPQYDIWGDTVNTASRLESNGIMGRIQVTDHMADILMEHGQFEVECRGPIEVKGKGRLTTYLVKTPFDAKDGESAEETAIKQLPRSPSIYESYEYEPTIAPSDIAIESSEQQIEPD